MASQSLCIFFGLALVAIGTAAQLTSSPLLETITIASERSVVDPQNPVLHRTTVSADGLDIYVNRAQFFNGSAKNFTTDTLSKVVVSTRRGTSIFSQPPSALKAAIASSSSGNSTYLPNSKSRSGFLGVVSRPNDTQTNSKTLSAASSILVATTATGFSQIVNETITSSKILGTSIPSNNSASLSKHGVDQVKLGSDLPTSVRSTLNVTTSVASIASDWKSSNSTVTSPASLMISMPNFASKQIGRVTSSTNANSSVNNTGPTVTATSASSIGSAEISDAIVLGAALMQLSSSASRAGSNILKQPTKAAFIQSIASLKPKLKGLGGIDESESCAGLKKRRGRWQRNLVSNILNALSNSCGSLVTIANLLKGNTPNLAAIDQQWNIVGASAEELQNSADSEDNDEKQIQASQDGKSTKSAEDQDSKTSDNLKTTSSPVSSQTSMRRSSSISQTASAPDKIDCYSGTEYAYPASYSAPASATNAIFDVLGLALLAQLGAYVPDVTTSAINATAHTTNKSAMTSSAMNSSIPTTVLTSSSAQAESSARPATLDGEISLVTAQLSNTHATLTSEVTSTPPVPTSAAAPINAEALGGEIAAIAQEIASASAATVTSSKTTSPSLANSPVSSSTPTSPKYGIYVSYQVYTAGGAHALSDYYSIAIDDYFYNVWMADLTKYRGGPDFCVAASSITNERTYEGVTNVPTDDIDFAIPAGVLESAAIPCTWHPPQPGTLTCDRDVAKVLCTVPAETDITCKEGDPDRIFPFAQCVWQ